MQVRLLKPHFVIQGTSLMIPERQYTVDYYKRMSKELEATGAHILAIKDMAGLVETRGSLQTNFRTKGDS